VDTGASNVVLSHQAARAIGLDPDTLAYTQLTSTTNGMGRSAPVTLSSIQVGDITLRDVRGSVNMAYLDQSLLGMSFLSRLSGFSIESGELVLYR
jgi:aspartyl protease family protein